MNDMSRAASKRDQAPPRAFRNSIEDAPIRAPPVCSGAFQDVASVLHLRLCHSRAPIDPILCCTEVPRIHACSWAFLRTLEALLCIEKKIFRRNQNFGRTWPYKSAYSAVLARTNLTIFRSYLTILCLVVVHRAPIRNPELHAEYKSRGYC